MADAVTNIGLLDAEPGADIDQAEQDIDQAEQDTAWAWLEALADRAPQMFTQRSHGGT